LEGGVVSDKPTDDTIALAGFLRGEKWMSADEIRLAIEKLGFARPSSQWVTGRLIHMCRESAPRFERRRWFDWAEYRVTSFAATGLQNKWRGFEPTRDLKPLPTPKREDLR
jgi:hypothetical protein